MSGTVFHITIVDNSEKQECTLECSALPRVGDIIQMKNGRFQVTQIVHEVEKYPFLNAYYLKPKVYVSMVQ